MSKTSKALKRSLREVEEALKTARMEYGDKLYSMRNIDGDYLVAGLLASRVDGYSALLLDETYKRTNKKK